VLDGMNESGLAVSLAFGGRQAVGDGFGIPVILRYVLEFCATTAEGVEVLKRVPSHMSYNITLVDAQQRFATVYVAPDRRPVVRQVPIATNHQGRIEWRRHAWATATLEREHVVTSRLADCDVTAEGFVDGFLQPPLFNIAYQRGFGTLYTAVYRPQSGRIEYLWRDQSWPQSFAQFSEGSRTIQLVAENHHPVQHSGEASGEPI
jgi:predicted choloylglycine hydrolase